MSIKRIVVMLVSTLLIVSLYSPAFTAVPNLINYQGRLTSADGAPVLNGSYFLTFALYLTDIGSSPEWAETQEVVINNGLYHVLLGSVIPFSDSLFGDSLYLGVTVAPDQEMVPRQLLVSSPYAIRAEVANTIAEGAITNVHIMDNSITG
jgi:hypothetical protein